MKSTLSPSGAVAKTRTRETASTSKTLTSQQAKLAALSAAPAMIGLWSAACLLGAMMASGGPFALARCWFQAVTGM